MVLNQPKNSRLTNHKPITKKMGNTNARKFKKINFIQIRFWYCFWLVERWREMFKPSFIDEVSHSWSESKPIMSNPQQQTSLWFGQLSITALLKCRRKHTTQTLGHPEHLYPDLCKPYTGTWTRHQFNTGIRLIQISTSLLCVLVPDSLLLFLLTNDTLVANGVDDPYRQMNWGRLCPSELNGIILLQDTNLGKMEYQPDPALGRKMKDYGSVQTGKMKGTREEFQGQQLEFLIWRLLEV